MKLLNLQKDLLFSPSVFYVKLQLSSIDKKARRLFLLAIFWFLTSMILTLLSIGTKLPFSTFAGNFLIFPLIVVGLYLIFSTVLFGINRLFGGQKSFTSIALGFVFIASLGLSLFLLVLMLLYAIGFSSNIVVMNVLILLFIYLSWHAYNYFERACGFAPWLILGLLFLPVGLIVFLLGIPINEFSVALLSWSQSEVSIPVFILYYVVLLYIVFALSGTAVCLVYLLFTRSKETVLHRTVRIFVSVTIVMISIPGLIFTVTFVPRIYFALLTAPEETIPASLQISEPAPEAVENYYKMRRALVKPSTEDWENLNWASDFKPQMVKDLEQILSAFKEKRQCAYPEAKRKKLFKKMWTGRGYSMLDSMVIMRAAKSHTVRLWQQGETERSLEVLEKTLNASNCLFQAPGSMIDFLVAIAMRGITLDGVAEILEDDVPVRKKKELYKALKEYDGQIIADSLQKAYAGEYQFGILYQELGGVFKTPQFSEWIGDPFANILGVTKDSFARSYSLLQEQARRPYYEFESARRYNTFFEILWNEPLNPLHYYFFQMTLRQFEDMFEDSSAIKKKHNCFLLYLHEKLRSTEYQQPPLDSGVQKNPLTGKPLTSDCLKKLPE